MSFGVFDLRSGWVYVSFIKGGGGGKGLPIVILKWRVESVYNLVYSLQIQVKISALFARAAIWRCFAAEIYP